MISAMFDGPDCDACLSAACELMRIGRQARAQNSKDQFEVPERLMPYYLDIGPDVEFALRIDNLNAAVAWVDEMGHQIPHDVAQKKLAWWYGLDEQRIPLQTAATRYQRLLTLRASSGISG